MTAETFIFYGFALLTAAGALMLALTKNVIYAVFLLFTVLFGVAGMYVFAGAEFLAVAQVIIYVGGILVILLFGVMLTHKIREGKPETGIANLLPGAAAAGGLFLAILFLIRHIDFAAIEAAHHAAAARAPGVDVEVIGRETITHYLLPFELISVLLLAVLIGAAYLTRKYSRPGKEEGT